MGNPLAKSRFICIYLIHMNRVFVPRYPRKVFYIGISNRLRV